ncbi:hypothetical protein GOBAR_AA35724 [Gossypium barbadense]|uniref:Uncharacterized protein n=1 Tax=Gossypium barbadense TaxID=3634 RepID=A0A2P5W1M5_GOSBA|nr:hypothetical protein GOBAR_AA35724 [Gossypium barbadense]
MQYNRVQSINCLILVITTGNRRSAGFTIEERQSFSTNFLSRGFVDTFRKQNPDVVGYTYWGYRHGARKGWRLDYFLVSDAIADDVHDSFILPDVIGSDHCPIGLGDLCRGWCPKSWARVETQKPLELI